MQIEFGVAAFAALRTFDDVTIITLSEQQLLPELRGTLGMSTQGCSETI